MITAIPSLMKKRKGLMTVIGNIYVNSELFAGVQEKDKIVNIAAILKNMTTIQTTIQFETTKPVCDKI